MFNRRVVLTGVAASLAVTAAAPALAQDWKAKYPEIVFAVIPAENASGVTERYAPFVAYLSNELGTKVTLRIANDYAALIAGQRAGNIHIGMYGPASFARALLTGVKTEAFCHRSQRRRHQGLSLRLLRQEGQPLPEGGGPQGQEPGPRGPQLHVR